VVRFLVHLYALSATLPFVSFAVVWLASYLWRRNNKKAIKLAMDVTTLSLIGSVSYLFFQLFHTKFGFYFIVLFFLVGYGLAGNYQYRKKGKIDHVRIVRVLWRLAFFGLSVLYVLLAVAGLIQSFWSV
jgi:hypothetical protein